MSEHGTPHTPAAAHGDRHQAHASDATYWKIAVVLTVVTALEVATYYATFMRPILIPTILVLGTLKFALVAMYYMHLKFDSKLFSGFFLFGIMVATATIISFIALFKGLW